MSMIFALALLAGAQPASEPKPGSPAPVATPAAPASPPQPGLGRPRVSATRSFAPTGDPGIVERTWRLERINGENVGPQVTLRLENGGMVTGSTGCNRFSAGYELSGPALRIVPPLPRANLVCAPAVGSLEARVRDSLLRIRSWTITPSGALSLDLAGGGTLVFHAI